MEPGTHGVVSARREQGRWRGNCQIRTISGNYLRIRRNGRTKREAIARTLAAAQKSALSWTDGQSVPPVVIITSASTVTELVTAYLDEAESRGDLSAASLTTYRSALRAHITPDIGGLAVREVSPRILTAWLRTLSPGPWQTSRALLSGAWTWALREGHIDGPHVVRDAPAPPRAPSAPETATPHAIRRLVEAAEAYRDDGSRPGPRPPRAPWFPPLLLVLLATGARLSEALAMRWEDIDGLDSDGDVVVHLRGVKGRSGGRGADAARTRPRAGVLPPFGVAALRAWRATLGEAAAHTPWVWPTSGLRSHISVDNISRTLAHIRAYLPEAHPARDISAHTLRRSAATWARRAHDEPTVAAWLGHAPRTVTARHYLGHEAVDVAAALQAAWEDDDTD